MEEIKDYRDHVGSRLDKHYKTTLFQSERLMLGLNCLEPGQEQSVHAHTDQDKFYFVLEGEGLFTIGEKQESARQWTDCVGCRRCTSWCKKQWLDSTR